MWWILLLLACGDPEPPPVARSLPTPEVLSSHCRDTIGPPRVEQVTERIWVALGFDLANTILVATDAGHVIIDVGMNPARAAPARAALLEENPGPIRHVIYTHSHIDHVGGAETWVEEGTEIWATETFPAHFFKQYGTFLPVEAARAQRQFGRDVSVDDLPCSALGRRVDLEGTLRNGARMPTQTFSGSKTLDVGGTRIDLIEAHGETHDQLFVWLPEERVLMPGDNWYRSFPNLYTIRGSQPRPVDAWIDSLDRMRRLEPKILVPSHSGPVRGEQAVQDALRNYRDAIQWVRDAVVRGANAGEDVDTLANGIGLPPHLATEPALAELYGQVDWSVRAIYSNHLGWFDGRTEALYPLPRPEQARRTIAAMGGADSVREAAGLSDEPRWSIHLLSLLEANGEDVSAQLASAYEAVAEEVYNTNGRGYLLRAAAERREGMSSLGEPDWGPDFVDAIPVELLFDALAGRLKAGAALGVHESVVVALPDDQFVITVRRGVAEVVQGEPLPGTPDPLATARTDARSWRRLALQLDTPAAALASGRLEIQGSALGFARFMNRFERGLAPPPRRLP
jgi:alkyl sulfatase BDS1-like metallo-beta-lactamase superfamily hydrolase